ncbi:hypothetical protein OAK03_06885, partial [Gammaproteobacteria bacterium]|nr:hypothetical protein [Gammaproteobacteria bacterium]
NTGKPLSETTFNPWDTPSIMVIRMGDVNQSFEPIKYWFQRGLDLNGKPLDIINYEDNNYEEKFGTSIAMTSDTNTIIIGAPDANVVVVREFTSDIEKLRAGKARVFDWNGGTWIQHGQDIFNDETSDCLNSWGSDLDGNKFYDIGSGYGTSVDITDDGDTVVLGAPGHATRNFIFRNPCLANGAAHVFRWESTGDQTGWKKNYFISQDGGNGNISNNPYPYTFYGGQGSQVAISNVGNRVVTGGIGTKFSFGSNFIQIIRRMSQPGIVAPTEAVFSHLAVWSEDPFTYPWAYIDVFDKRTNEEGGEYIAQMLPEGVSPIWCLKTKCVGTPGSSIYFYLCEQAPHYNWRNLGSCGSDANALNFEDSERVTDASMAMSVTVISYSEDSCKISGICHVVNYQKIAVLIKSTDPNQQAYVRMYKWMPSEEGSDGVWSSDKWEQLGSDIELPSGYNFSSIKLSSDGNTLAVNANTGGQTTGPGHVQVYNWNNNDWVKRGDNIDGKTGDSALQSLVLSDDGNTVAFGVPETGHGVVRIYDFK